MYRILQEDCGLGSGSLVLEVAPGTGLATRRLLEAGAVITAAEPNPAMASYLRASFRDEERLHVMTVPFEEAVLAAGSFDLVVVATFFHWVGAEGRRKVSTSRQPLQYERDRGPTVPPPHKPHPLSERPASSSRDGSRAGLNR